MHAIKSTKEYKTDWCNEYIHETQMQFIYGGSLNNHKKDTWQTRHGYEQ